MFYIPDIIQVLLFKPTMASTASFQMARNRKYPQSFAREKPKSVQKPVYRWHTTSTTFPQIISFRPVDYRKSFTAIKKIIIKNAF
jgi:hypothetical protein